MALQSKLQGSKGFTPAELVLVKERSSKKVRVDSAPIRWDQLTHEEYRMQWGQCLNVVHTYENENTISRNDLFPAFVQYLKVKRYTQEQIEILKAASENDVTFSIVSKAYLLMSTGVDHPGVVETDKWLTQKLKAIIAKAAKIQPAVPEVPKRTIQQAMRDKCGELLGELQGLEDEMDSKADFLQFFTERGTPKVFLDRIEDMFRPRLEELQEVLDGTDDDQLQEGYAAYRKQELRKMIAFYTKLLDDVATYRGVKIATRKKPVRKPKPPAKLVAKLKYLVADDDLNINSISPQKLVGATTAWLYNTRTRKLIVYNASDYEKQLTVKGTYIVGWDPRTSTSKTLRWPEEQLAEFMQTTGKVAQRSFLTAIKAKETALKGKVNSDMLILRVT